AIKLSSTNTIVVQESGNWKGGFGSVTNGDVLKIERTGNTITYKKNGTTFYTSSIPSTSSLLVDACFYHSGGEINNGVASFENNTVTLPAAPSELTGTASATRVQLSWTDNADNESGFRIERQNSVAPLSTVTTASWIGATGADETTYIDATVSPSTTYIYKVYAYNAAGDSEYSNTITVTTSALEGTPLTWTSLIGTEVQAGNTLAKTAEWGTDNGGAASVEVLPAGRDGWVEMIAFPTRRERYFGLSQTNDDATNNIDYSFKLNSVDKVVVSEGGQTKAGFGDIIEGDLLRIERKGNTIYYSQNGTLLYTSEVPSTTSLVVDASLYHSGGEINGARVSFDGKVADKAEIAALRDLYQYSGGTGWTDQTGWPSDWSSITSVNQIVDWYGITVENGDVTGINLSNNNLNGTIRSSLGNLTELQILRMDNAQISGGKGSSVNLNTLLSAFTHLREISFENCAISSASFPEVINTLQELEYLSLTGNTIGGQIPDLSALDGLMHLDLSRNKFYGSLPPSCATLPDLLYLNLSSNKLTGPVPDFPATSKLTELNLSKLLIKQLPDLTQLPNLTKVDVHQCQLTFSEIEKQLTAANTSPFEFIYHSQIPQTYNEYIEVSVGGVLEINSLDASTHNVYLWEKLEEDGGNLIATDVTDQNENTDGSIFKLSN
ncbi:fibronectin type III domain-containing protein, partial [Fulvivirga imtechensis]|uniref:leucine-rich repeat domain-containing protein n=1 Tax=Fulvivirga imtechensis TaxID=881893 RepID=UPI0005913BB6